MAGESQPAHTGLTAKLGKEIWRVNFYRYCQLLEQENPGKPLLGASSHPGHDPVRFRPWPRMGFPVSEMRAVEWDEDNRDLPSTVRTTFLGMYGVDSPLPGSYLDDIAQRREGHEALTAFLDIFSHRITTQYYRIWRKYAYPASFEAGGTDKTSQCLLGLVGLGIPGTAQHVATPVSRFLALLGTMRLPTRNAEGIQALVRLLAPATEARISEHDPVIIPMHNRSGLSKKTRCHCRNGRCWANPPVRVTAGCGFHCSLKTLLRRRAGYLEIICIPTCWRCCVSIWVTAATHVCN